MRYSGIHMVDVISWANETLRLVFAACALCNGR